MKDDSPQHQHRDRFNLRDSAETTQFNVKGMEKVLATVSGYHGAERFNLIKLINSTGASYVGNMNQAITHLVCLKFEGRKYELAKKFKIEIVNHRWIEECIKKGRHVSEEPYTFQSGEQVGPLCLDILLGINQAKAQSKALKNTKQPVIDIESDDLDDGTWMDSTFLDEDLFPRLKQNSLCSNKSIRKAIKRNSRKDCSSSGGYCLETPSGPRVMELEEASTSLPAYSRILKKRNSTSPEPLCKGRRLVKKHIRMEDWLLTSNVEEGCKEGKMLPENNSSAGMSDISDVDRHQPASSRHAHDVRFSLSGQDNSVHKYDIEEIQDENDENQKACCHGAASSLPATSEKLHEASHEDSVDVDHGNRHPASSELSCVICWTDFSSTRGVLPCGHRFCFSCIQSWADHMASRRKSSTCPLCKASFICITKVDDALSSDQKIYSQSIPHDSSNTDLYILPDETYVPPSNPSASVCCRCSSREPEDLLIRCHFCQLRCVHSYCLDPPLFPWTCVHCKDLQILYLQSR
ncbi:hypothetical protein CDL12_15391 [Handroanthus impetiginosus]|uniref:RING-type E3 ubiquitin transferase BRCA1 n=1 Tax=Handroanthus impetiginosus TaxID=429701 RepID=A0A2G9H3B4_9LAMI|nr:hypothetical protein CDL12_15391 [Handroanthus impetiginosus]